MSISESQLGGMIETLMSEMIGLEVKCESEDLELSKSTQHLTGCVQITGDWAGAILMDCTPSFASQIAGRMFEMEADELDDEMVMDALGEVVNVLAGNLKSLLDGSCRLALPSVMRGSDYCMGVLGCDLVIQTSFKCEDDVVTFTLLEKRNRDK